MTWLIIGAGVSGLGAATLLTSQRLAVRVSERSRLPAEKAQPFESLGVDLRDGGHDLSHLDGVDHVVLSPGVPQTHLLLVEARKRRLEVVSEIDLALRHFSGKLIAVTGTNGKSTTCAMIGHLLERRGLAVGVGGNFGDPPTLMLAQDRTQDYLVLELSSYQLEQTALVAPLVAIFTSFSHDHLARHGSLEGYLRAKWRLFDRMPTGSLALIPAEILAQAEAIGLTIDTRRVKILSDAAALGQTAPDFIKEPHNRLNAGFALAAVAHVLSCSPAELAPLLAGFQGLRHRCELIGTRNQLPVINDSKSTNVESTLVALAAQDGPVVLLLGGQGKGEPYSPILTQKAKIAAVISFGASGPEIARDLKEHVTVHEFPTLRDALSQIGGIMKRTPAGILFSPGCASFDEFANYEERGETFRKSMLSFLDS